MTGEPGAGPPSPRSPATVPLSWPLHTDPAAFGDLPAPPDPVSARFAVLPIPYDGSATWKRGASRAPEAILAASRQLERYDIETRTEPCAAGIVTMAPVTEAGSPEAQVDATRAACLSLIDAGKTVVGLGGDHSVAIGLVRAHAERYPGLNVLQIDAHADTRDTYEGSPCNHACIMARAREVAPVVQVGLRAIDRSELRGLDPARTFYAHRITPFADPAQAWVQRVVARLDGPVYVTIDVDALDPSEMPATGTPEPGGLSYRQITRLLDHVARRHQVVGFDVCELLPLPGLHAAEYLAARLVYQIMGYLVREQRQD
ncbi:MAG: agmatinase [Candidatus Krumholzibacteriia bacterium]